MVALVSCVLPLSNKCNYNYSIKHLQTFQKQKCTFWSFGLTSQSSVKCILYVFRMWPPASVQTDTLPSPLVLSQIRTRKQQHVLFLELPVQWRSKSVSQRYMLLDPSLHFRLKRCRPYIQRPLLPSIIQQHPISFEWCMTSHIHLSVQLGNTTSHIPTG
jgi:hypothetical protein